MIFDIDINQFSILTSMIHILRMITMLTSKQVKIDCLDRRKIVRHNKKDIEGRLIVKGLDNSF